MVEYVENFQLNTNKRLHTVTTILSLRIGPAVEYPADHQQLRTPSRSPFSFCAELSFSSTSRAKSAPDAGGQGQVDQVEAGLEGGRSILDDFLGKMENLEHSGAVLDTVDTAVEYC